MLRIESNTSNMHDRSFWYKLNNIKKKIIMLSERSINIELDDNISPTKIVRKGVLIQVDETAICRGRIMISLIKIIILQIYNHW